MGKKWPPRPAQNFKIASIQWQIQIEANHRNAGFPEVSSEVIRRRFWQFLEFLSEKGYLVQSPATSLEEVVPSTTLMNSDLTDTGYLFVQRYEGKWIDRLYKDKGSEAERKFLEKWHAQFLSERASAS